MRKHLRICYFTANLLGMFELLSWSGGILNGFAQDLLLNLHIGGLIAVFVIWRNKSGYQVFMQQFGQSGLRENRTFFENKTSSVGEVGHQIKTKVAMWMKAKFDIKVYSIEDFKIFLDGIHTLKL